MAIIRGLDVNLRSMDEFAMLVHGDYNTFKTFLTGAFLEWMIRQGKKALYWSIRGENYSTIANFPEINPKEHIWVLETWQDIEQGQAELTANPVDGWGVDSGKLLADKVMLKHTGGEDRPLRIPKGKGDYSQEWPYMHHDMERKLQAFRQCSKRIVMTCPSDLSSHHLDPSTETWTKEKRITPNFPGNEATRSPGWFDFVGYCEIKGLTDSVERHLHFEYSKNWVARANIMRQFREPILVPEVVNFGNGYKVWEAIQNAIEERMK